MIEPVYVADFATLDKPIFLPEQRKLKSMNLSNFLDLQIPQRGMILNPIIPEKGLTMLYAPRGIGKTFVALNIALAVATGKSMFNNKWSAVKPSKVLLVDGEMPAYSLQDRLKNMELSNNVDTSDLDNLQILSSDLQEIGIPDLSTVDGQQLIEEHLDGVKLLILDNLSALCISGRENESESWLPMQKWLSFLKRRGISVLLIHHANKAGNQRGNSKKEDLLDTVIVLRRVKNYCSQDGAKFEIHYEKARGFYGEAAKSFAVELKEDEGKLIWNVSELEEGEITRILALEQEGLSHREIAEELGMSASTVNRRLKKIKEGKLIN